MGVEASITNKGTRPYKPDTGGVAITLRTSAGRKPDEAFVSGGDCQGTGGGNLNLLPGDTERLCIPYEVRQNDDAEQVRATLSADDVLQEQPG